MESLLVQAGSEAIGYAVLAPILLDHLVGDDIPSWQVKRFDGLADVELCRIQNREAGFSELLPVVSRRGTPASDSIRNHLDSMGAPTTVRSPGRALDDLVENGERSIHGEVFLDSEWRFEEFDEVMRLKGLRMGCPNVDTQLRAEIVALEAAYLEVHGQLPIPVFWRSRQVVEALLRAARFHRDDVLPYGRTNYDVWESFQWRVEGLAAFSRRAEVPVYQPAKGEVVRSAVNSGRRSWAEADRFERRAAWLLKIMSERGLSAHHIQKNTGPDRKSTKRILDGHGVTDDVLGKLLRALNLLCEFSPKLTLKDVPRD